MSIWVSRILGDGRGATGLMLSHDDRRPLGQQRNASCAGPAVPAVTTRRSFSLTHPTIDQLHQLGLTGIARAFTELEASGRAMARTMGRRSSRRGLPRS